MSRRFSMGAVCICLLVCASCRDQKAAPTGIVVSSNPASVAQPAPFAVEPVGIPVELGEPENEFDREFDPFYRRLAEMKTVVRGPGETLLTGEAMVFDYVEKSVRMEGAVEIEDDYGSMETRVLNGRFSESNRIDYIEAKDGVRIVAGNRVAEAREAVYRHAKGTVELFGQAKLSEGANQLSGERILFQVKGDRMLVCEPNALLVLGGGAGSEIADLPDGVGETEIRADRVSFDEKGRRIDLSGKVRLRSDQVAINCKDVHVFLKEENKIDWIEAVGDVIIQSLDRKALAEQLTYDIDEGKITLEGHPVVMQGRSTMTGDRIVFWQESRSMVCEPNARVLLYLDEETRTKLLQDLND